MKARIIVLGLTVRLALLMIISSVGLANGAENGIYKLPSEQGLQYDHQMVEKAPEKSKSASPALPYTVLSWRPYL